MKILVTGALGHIGSRLIRDLPARFSNSEIVMIDNMMTQRYPSLFDLPKTAQYRFIEADMLDIDMEALLKDIDVVVHLAAMTDAASSAVKAEEVEQNNFRATEKLAKACAKTGAKLIALSSTSVYGTQAEVVDENCTEDELKPQSPYAKTKLKEEECVRALCKQDGLNAVVCRFGTIFGTSPGMRFHTAVNKFCWQAVMGQPITVWRTALNQKRPYLDLDDAIDALCFIIEKDIFDGEVYNILTCNTDVQSITDAIKTHIPDCAIELVDHQIMNQLSYEVLCDKFKAHGFTFSGDLQRGIKSTINLIKI